MPRTAAPLSADDFTDEQKQRFLAKGKLDPATGCLLWPGKGNQQGYGRWRKHRSEGAISAHRIAYALQVGPIPADRFIMHKCDNPGCINPDHLVLGDHEANVRDKVAKERQHRPVGVRNPSARLTPVQVVLIRGDPRKQCVIAAEYGVSVQLVSAIKTRVAWRHL